MGEQRAGPIRSRRFRIKRLGQILSLDSRVAPFYLVQLVMGAGRDSPTILNTGGRQIRPSRLKRSAAVNAVKGSLSSSVTDGLMRTYSIKELL
jgi:hypothetical protein